jgi:hypothetical protein
MAMLEAQSIRLSLLVHGNMLVDELRMAALC